MPFLSVSFRAKDQWEAEDPILGDDQLGIEAVAVEPDGTLVFELNQETGQVQAKYKRGQDQTTWNTLPYEGLMNLYEDPGLINSEDFALVKQTADGAWTAAGQAVEKAGQALGATEYFQANVAAINEMATAAKTNAEKALGQAEDAETAGRAAEEKAEAAKEQAQSAQETADKARTMADKALSAAGTAGGTDAGVFQTEDEPIDANEVYDYATRKYLLNTESLNFPVEAPLYFEVVINSGASVDSEAGNSSVTQTVWDDPAGDMWQRLGAVTPAATADDDPTVAWGDWRPVGSGGGDSFSDAPDDGGAYVRKNLAWANLDGFGLGGVEAWSADHNYLAQTLVFGPNGTIYKCLQDNGPGTDAGVVDPANEVSIVRPGEQAGGVWTQVTLPVSSTWYGSMVVTNTGRIVALGYGTVCIYSDDDGTTWNQAPLPVSAAVSGGVGVTKTGRIVAVSNNSTVCIYSDNNGTAWAQVTLPVALNIVTRLVVTASGRIVALGYGTTGLYSDDNGTTWKQMTLPVSGTWGSTVVTASGRIVALVYGNAGMYSDDGTTWTKITLPVSGSWYGAMVVTKTGRIVAFSDNSTVCIYSDNNGTAWTQVTLPVSGSWYGSMVVTKTGRIVAFSRGSAVCIYSDNNGTAWTQVTLPVSGSWYGTMVVTKAGRIVAFSHSSAVCIYSDIGMDELTWNLYWEKLDTTPVGTSILAPGRTPPTRRAIQYDGGLLSRADYAALWAKVGSRFNPVEDALWTDGEYSTGDGATTFRIPRKAYNLVGTNEFLQAL